MDFSSLLASRAMAVVVDRRMSEQVHALVAELAHARAQLQREVSERNRLDLLLRVVRDHLTLCSQDATAAPAALDAALEEIRVGGVGGESEQEEPVDDE